MELKELRKLEKAYERAINYVKTKKNYPTLLSRYSLDAGICWYMSVHTFNHDFPYFKYAEANHRSMMICDYPEGSGKYPKKDLKALETRLNCIRYEIEIVLGTKSPERIPKKLFLCR